ncbi:MAG TPA: hypothetical protein VK662_10585 [Acidothermaceae bacterium]|jgi:hypothetical protein|nr:hypothetical protein [Acidothermaceae bacterium]
MTTSDRPPRPVRRARRRTRRVRLTRTIVVLLALALVTTAVIYGVKSLSPHHTVADSCQVVGETTGTIYAMDPEQLLNASIIADVAMRRGLPQQAVIIALATAQQESKLRNIDYGDADSIGLFQQRPSQGWGLKSQILDPVYASGKFFDALVKVRNWQGLTVAAAAQAVQRSAFPDAYTSWQPYGTALAAALTGTTLGQLTCRLGHPGVNVKGSKPSSNASTPASSALTSSAAASSPPADLPVPTSLVAAVSGLTSGLASDLEVTAPTVVARGTKSATITVTGLAPVGTGNDAQAEHRTATVSAWALAHASEGITSVVVGTQEWRPDRDGWHPTNASAAAGAVIITVATR